MKAPVTTRLTRGIWIETGLAALALDGPSALRAEPLARRLGMTKGSFYWHFTDLPTYHTAVLEVWENAAMDRIAVAAQGAQTDTGRLRHFAQTIAGASINSETANDTIDPAVRAWALGHDGAAAAVARLDAARLTRLRDLLARIGVGNQEMARILLGAGLGMAAMTQQNAQQNADAMGTLVDLVLALR